jgi:hypothetical protein
MFGGLAFLIRGNMAIAASNESGAMVRVDSAVGLPGGDDEGHAYEYASRDMHGWLRISPRDLAPTTPWPPGWRSPPIRALAAA